MSVTTAILNTLGLYRVKRQGANFFYSIGGGTPGGYWGEKTYDQYLIDAIEIPELNAILNYKARAASQVKFQIVSKETGKPVNNNEPIVRVLRKPNWYQSTQEWIAQAQLYRDIFGNEYHYFLAPTGMGTNYKALYCLPSQHVYIKCTDNRFFLNAGMPEGVEYKFILPNETQEYLLDTKDILHLNNNRVSHIPDLQTDSIKHRKNYLYGTSKLASLSAPIKNLRQAYEGRYTLRDLPAGVLSNQAKDTAGIVPMDDTEKSDLQDGLRQKYGLSIDKRQLIITGLALRMNETAVNIDKLKLYEETKEDTFKICDAFGVPPELFGSSSGITYENKKYAERQLYEDTTIPEMAERIAGINHKLGTESRSWEVIGTFDHLPIFQENMQERSTALQGLVNALNLALQNGAIDIDIYKKELKKFGIG